MTLGRKTSPKKTANPNLFANPFAQGGFSEPQQDVGSAAGLFDHPEPSANTLFDEPNNAP